MEGINQDDVIQILRILEESTFDELRLEVGGLKLVASKSGKKAEPEEKLKSDDGDSTEPKPAVTPAMEEKEEKLPVQQPSQDENGLIAIKSPMLGTFYSAPKPGADPFVEVGQLVSEEDTVCIIEVMKLFNTVKANVRGRVAKILAENGQMVEYQQTLFLMEELDDTETDGEENVS